MLDIKRLQNGLPLHGLGEPLHFFESIGSTNDFGMLIAKDGAAHGTLIVAEEQTEGKGRAGRRWVTPPETALAMSLVLRPERTPKEALGELTVLGAMAVVEALDGLGIEGKIKWPNDVLLSDLKVAGVLVEGSWIGDQLEHAILGIGINVRPESVPPRDEIDMPATCVDNAAGIETDRHDLLFKIISGVGRWLRYLGSPMLVDAWNQRLAYRGQWVIVKSAHGELVGELRSISKDGRLKITQETGENFEVAFGDVNLRPVDTDSKSTTLV
jgi:BirA family biotin operon repressor/biotin-[acetyl-CoA-carboxylase] ligase